MAKELQEKFGFVNDPERYAEMVKPHESVESADEAIEKFRDAVADARLNNRIAGYVCFAIAYYKDEHGNTKQRVVSTEAGNGMENTLILLQVAKERKQQYIEMFENI